MFACTVFRFCWSSFTVNVHLLRNMLDLLSQHFPCSFSRIVLQQELIFNILKLLYKAIDHAAHKSNSIMLQIYCHIQCIEDFVQIIQ